MDYIKHKKNKINSKNIMNPKNKSSNTAQKSKWQQKIVWPVLFATSLYFFMPAGQGTRIFENMLTFFSHPGYAQAKKKNSKGKNAKKQPGFQLDFHKATMAEFLKTMSDILRKNILIDGKVPGHVTIVSPQKIPIDQAFLVLKTVLGQYGFMPIEEHGIIRVVRIADAIKMDSELRITSDVSQFDPKKFEGADKNVTHVVVLRSALSNEVRGVIQNIASKNIKIVDYRKANALILVGHANEILRLISVAQELDRRTSVADNAELRRNIHIYHLENANAEKLAPVLARLRFQRPLDSETTEKNKTQKKVRRPNTRKTKNKKDDVKVDIIANKDTNSLIITAPPEIYRDVKKIIQELDTMRRQVLVEVFIVEISGDGSWGAGIEWRYGSTAKGVHEDANAIAGSTTNLGSDLVANAGALPGLSLGLLNKSLTTSDGTIQIPDIYGILNYYSRNQEVNVLSTPQILVTDNQEAVLNVGQQVPVVSNMRITDQNNTIRSYDLKPVGIQLKITPHINKNDYITLDIYQEVKALIGDTSQLVDVPPIISNRDIKTKITVRNQHTIVIGGLIQSEKTEIERKTPILGDIPILGWLFKRRTQTTYKTNLLVFITPYLINSPEDMRNITEQKRIQLERIRKLYDWRTK